MDGVEPALITVVPDVFPDVPVLVALPPPLSRLLPVLLRLILVPALMVAAVRILVALLVPVRLLELVVVNMGILTFIRFPFFETLLTPRQVVRQHRYLLSSRQWMSEWMHWHYDS